MKTQHVFNTAEELQKVIAVQCKQNRCKKIRVFEYDKSYEDYSVSHTLISRLVYNFTIAEDETHLFLCKTAKNSTRHIKFPKGNACIVEYVYKHVPYLSIKVQADVFYSDGTHRYRK